MAESTAAPVSARRSVLGERNFRLLLIGETVSVLGTQFHIVALQWLVLSLSASGLVLGTVLMAAAIPRAILMLVGGAVSDRVSPRTLMILSNAARAVIVAMIAVLAWSGGASIANLLVLVFLFGVADAFFYPAYMSALPRVLAPKQLGAGNSLLQGSAQLMSLIGPSVAGFTIAAAGVAPAFMIDSLSFIAATAVLLMMTKSPLSQPPSVARGAVVTSILEGFRYAFRDPLLRTLLLITAIVNIAFMGPFVVGTALLANEFGSAVSLGLMLGASGAGALAGTLLAGAWQPQKWRGIVVLVLPCVIGVGLLLLAFTTAVEQAVVVRALIGFATGYSNIFTVTLLQRRIEPAMMGRVMSLVMFVSLGLHPFSYLFSGLLAPFGTSTLFAVGAALLFAATGVASLSREVRRFE